MGYGVKFLFSSLLFWFGLGLLKEGLMQAKLDQVYYVTQDCP